MCDCANCALTWEKYECTVIVAAAAAVVIMNAVAGFVFGRLRYNYGVLFEVHCDGI